MCGHYMLEQRHVFKGKVYEISKPITLNKLNFQGPKKFLNT